MIRIDMQAIIYILLHYLSNMTSLLWDVLKSSTVNNFSEILSYMKLTLSHKSALFIFHLWLPSYVSDFSSYAHFYTSSFIRLRALFVLRRTKVFSSSKHVALDWNICWNIWHSVHWKWKIKQNVLKFRRNFLQKCLYN